MRLSATLRPVAVALALVVLVVLAVAVGPPGTAAGQPGAQATPRLRIPFPQDDGSLTPYTFELGYPLMALVYDTLLWRDAEGRPQPWLARSVDATADGLSLTVHLAPGTRWHDGQPVTAGDVAFTFDYMARRPHPRFTPELRQVQGVAVLDPATAVITLSEPSPGFADQPLADVPILPAHLWRDLPADRPAPDGLAVGSGPYRITEYRPGQGWRFEANPDYFRGAPAVQVIEVPVIRDVDETLRAFNERRVDVVSVSLPRAELELVSGLGASVARGPSYLGTVLMFNLRRPPFDRLEARQAVARALDPVRVARAVGGAVAADQGYLHPDSGWAPGIPMSEAGVAPPPGAVGAPFRVLAPDNDPVKMEAGRQVVRGLARFGIDAELVAVSRDELERAVGEDGSPPSFEAAIWNAPALASYDPGFLRRLFGTDPLDARSNLSGYDSRAFDAIAGRVATTLDPGARRAAVAEAVSLLDADVPVVPLFFADGAFAYRRSAYDGWVYVKGSGILDKRSFVEPRPASDPEAFSPSPSPSSGGGGRGLPFGWAAAVVLGLAGLLAAAQLVGSRRRSSTS